MTTIDLSPDVRIICADCRDVLPVESDVIITDPPYGISLGNHAGSKEKRMGLIRRSSGYDDTVEYFDNIVVPIINLCVQEYKRNMVFGIPPSIWKFPPPNAIGGIFIKNACGRNAWGWSNFIHCLLYGKAPNLHLGAKPTGIENNHSRAIPTGHPTTKPLDWMIWAVMLGSCVNETILDPFMGSGTTGIACIRTGRKFIGIEKNPDYFEIARQRLERELAQGKLSI